MKTLTTNGISKNKKQINFEKEKNDFQILIPVTKVTKRVLQKLKLLR